MSHHTIDKSLTELMEGRAKKTPLQFVKDVVIRKEEDPSIVSLGPTGDFPDGKLVPHDEGGLIFGVTIFNGCVVLDFGKPIRSIGFTREDALQLAEILQRRAMQCPPIIKKQEGP